MAAIQTFKNLQDQVLGWLDQAGDTDITLTNVKNAINQMHQARLAQEEWPFLLWDSAETFTLSANDRFYSLHPEFWRPDYFRNTTSHEFLVETPRRSVAGTGEVPESDTGRGPYFRWAGVTNVNNQPTSASVITIVSSSASDTGSANAITIHGISSGARTSETINPSGTSSVAGSTSFTKILKVTKASAWVGTLTVTSNAGAVTNLTLLPGEYARFYRQIELLRAPTQADTIEYRFFRQPSVLTADNDIPDIPPPHAQILVWDTLLLFAGYHSDLSPQAVKLWMGLQKEMEDDMRRLWLEGTSLEAQVRYVRYQDEDPGHPRIFTN